MRIYSQINFNYIFSPYFWEKMKDLNAKLKKFNLKIKEINKTLIIYEDKEPILVIYLTDNLHFIEKDSLRYPNIRQGLISKSNVPYSFYKIKKLSFFKTIKSNEDIFDLIISEVFP